MKPLDPRLVRTTAAVRAHLALTVACGFAATALILLQAWLVAHAIGSATDGACPSTYHVTTRVHSPASVAAIASPTSALSSVDLPAFTLPASASRSGSSSRSRWCCSHRSDAGRSRYTATPCWSTVRTVSRSRVGAAWIMTGPVTACPPAPGPGR